LGWILMRLGRTAEAQSELSGAAGLLAAIRQQSPSDADAEIELARVRMLQGEMITVKLESRVGHLAEAAEILQRHASGTAADRHVTEELGSCLTRLARLRQKRGDHVAARETFDRAEQVLSQLVKQDPDDRESCISYAEHLQNFGNHFLATGQCEAAEAKYRQGADVARRFMANDPTDAEVQHVYAVAVLNQGASLYRQKRFADADTLFGESIAVLEQLVANYPSFPQYRLRLAGVLMNAGLNAQKLREPDRGIARAEQAVKVLEYLTEKWPTVRQYHGNLGGALSNLAWVLSIQERELDRAEGLAQRSIEQQRLALESPEDVNNFLMKHYSVLALIQRQLGRWSQVRETCHMGLLVAERLKEKYPADPDISFNQATFKKLLDEASDEHRTAIKPDPNNANHFRLGNDG
jgi:tetratricopeptide (TPR) repeat protein